MHLLEIPTMPLDTPTLSDRKEGSVMEVDVKVKKRGSKHNQLQLKFLIIQIL